VPHIFTTEGFVLVVDSRFVVTSGVSDIDPAPACTSTADFVIATESSLVCVSAWKTHEAEVQLDYWSEPPPALVGWDRQHTYSLRRGKGPAQILSLAGPVACELDLAIPADAVIQARVASRAGTSLVQAVTAGTAPHGAIEQWLVQLWPSPTL
jgi:hypothetical protein